MDIHDTVTLELPYWQASFLLGWIQAQREHSKEPTRGIWEAIGRQVAGSVQP